MKVLVVGSGAREHALAWKLRRSPSVKQVFCLPGNAGTRAIATNVAGSVNDLDGVLKTVKANGIDFVVVGPEEPLVNGLVDWLREAGVLAFGPDRQGARLEGSKSFSKELMAEAGVPTAAFKV